MIGGSTASSNIIVACRCADADESERQRHRVELASLNAQRRRLPFPKRAAVAILLRRRPPLPPLPPLPQHAAPQQSSACADSSACACHRGESASGRSDGQCGCGAGRLEMLFILRAKNERDRWSGQVGESFLFELHLLEIPIILSCYFYDTQPSFDVKIRPLWCSCTRRLVCHHPGRISRRPHATIGRRQRNAHRSARG